MTPQADVHTLTGAYALNALPPQDRERFEQHLADCPSCSQEVAEFSETLARLGSAEAAEPPVELRERTLAAAQHTRQLPPAVPGARSDELSKRRDRRRGRWQWVSAIAAAVAIVAAVVLGYQTVTTNQRLDELRAANESYAALTKTLATHDVRIVSRTTDSGGKVTAVVSNNRGAAVVLTSGLPRPPKDRTYQVWVMSPPKPRSAGLLSSTEEGRAQLVAHGIDRQDKIGLTIEPAGGSPQPTSSPVIVLPL